MKKIMLIAAIICAGVAAQAANIDWSVLETVKKANYGVAADLTKYTAYLISQSVWDGFTALSSTQGNTSEAFAGLAKAGTASISVTQGDFKDATLSKYGTGSVQSLASAASGTYYVVLANDKGYYASSARAGTSYDHAADPLPAHDDPKISIAMGTAPLGSSSFTSFATAAPEPTSGLLILLGMAGLALRRRRA